MNDVSTFSADVAAVDTKIEKVGLSLYLNQVAHQTGTYPGCCSIKRQRVFLLPLDVMLVHHRVTPSIKCASTHLYTWVETSTLFCSRTQNNVPGQDLIRSRAYYNQEDTRPQR